MKQTHPQQICASKVSQYAVHSDKTLAVVLTLAACYKYMFVFACTVAKKYWYFQFEDSEGV